MAFYLRSCATIFALSSCRTALEMLDVPYLCFSIQLASLLLKPEVETHNIYPHGAMSSRREINCRLTASVQSRKPDAPVVVS